MIQSDTSHSVFLTDTELKNAAASPHLFGFKWFLSLLCNGSVKGHLLPISPYFLCSWKGVSECITAGERDEQSSAPTFCLVLLFSITSTAQFLFKPIP